MYYIYKINISIVSIQLLRKVLMYILIYIYKIHFLKIYYNVTIVSWIEFLLEGINLINSCCFLTVLRVSVN